MMGAFAFKAGKVVPVATRMEEQMDSIGICSTMAWAILKTPKVFYLLSTHRHQ